MGVRLSLSKPFFVKTSMVVFFVERNGIKNVSRIIFATVFLVIDTNFLKKLFAFSKKSLELTKNHNQKLIASNGLHLYVSKLNAKILNSNVFSGTQIEQIKEIHSDVL